MRKRMLGFGAVVVSASLACTSCAPADDSLAGYIRGVWDCVMEEGVAEGTLLLRFTIDESVIDMAETYEGSTADPRIVRLPYAAAGDRIEVDADRDEPLVIEASGTVSEGEDIAVTVVFEGRTELVAEIGERTLRVLAPSLGTVDQETFELIRCERAD